MVSCHQVTTVEGVGTADCPHPLQSRLADCHGVQGGYDSPGIIVSAYCLLLNCPRPTLDQIEKCLIGNLSRDNGYRALLESFKEPVKSHIDRDFFENTDSTY